MAKKKKLIKVEEPEVEEPMDEIIQEGKNPKSPQFKNNGDSIKIKLIDGEDFKWITVKNGDIVNIPRRIALANKLEEVK